MYIVKILGCCFFLHLTVECAIRDFTDKVGNMSSQERCPFYLKPGLSSQENCYSKYWLCVRRLISFTISLLFQMLMNAF